MGCKAIQPSSEKVVYKSDTLIHYLKDSVYIHNFDTVKIFQRGDTVFQYDVKWRIKYKELIKTDTVIKIDSVQIQETKVSNRMNQFQNAFFWLGMILFLVFIVYIIWKLRKIFI